MNSAEQIRAWKDTVFRRHLNPKQRDEMAAHPSGISILTDEELRVIVGAGDPDVQCTCSPSAITSVTTHPGCPDC
jgi:mersacidin/lichenicidin family type 2 lantibiotic